MEKYSEAFWGRWGDGQGKILCTIGAISSLPLLSLSSPQQTQKSPDLRLLPTYIFSIQASDRKASFLKQENSPSPFTSEQEQSQLPSPALAAVQCNVMQDRWSPRWKAMSTGSEPKNSQEGKRKLEGNFQIFSSPKFVGGLLFHSFVHSLSQYFWTPTACHTLC